MILSIRRLIASVGLATLASVGTGVAQPSLILTQDGVTDIRAAEAEYPLFEAARSKAMTRLDRSIEEGIIVPQPADPGGGYTHERHKENYKIIHDGGILFQLTGDERYLRHVESMLLEYAEMYGDLPLHPQRKEQSPGRLFWQGLNESVFLVYAIQGYDAVRADLSADVRESIENDFLRPMADFLSIGSPETFRRIHNHGTWAAAGVGMTGYALNDPDLVSRAIDGMDGDGTSGYLAQLNQLFSPDGYYTEGPYYQRYALMPFVVFARAIETNEPERAIFEHRDGILLKAIDATIQQSYGGLFFPINDAIREKGLNTIELVYGAAIAYSMTGDAGLLAIADLQGQTILSGDGLKLAKAHAAGDAEDYKFKTMVLSDGPAGKMGGLGVLRMGAGMLAQTVVAKHTGQGMGHGHFDKLALIVYDNGQEILSDYGAARFLNVPSKAGGRYLPENTTWAKQSIAHNTAVVDGTSHFDGNWRVAQESAPTITHFGASDDVNIISATIDDAYDHATLSRTTVQLRESEDASPIVIDVLDVVASRPSRVDVPFYFNGQLVDADMDLQRGAAEMGVFGAENGYQHLWVEAQSQELAPYQRLAWLTAGRFYSLHLAAPTGTDLSVVRTGATDPSFNLRSEQGLIQTVEGTEAARFVSVLEPHGLYDPAAEFTVGSESEIANVSVHDGNGGELVVITKKDGTRTIVGLADSPKRFRRTSILFDGKRYRWSGKYKIFRE